MRLPSLLTLFYAASALAALPYKGVDWSSLLIEEKSGKTYKNAAGQTQPLETILKNSGVTHVRQVSCFSLRLVDPTIDGCSAPVGFSRRRR
jgi:arabinogalactan endo-1,4-beta-galactosidase